MITFFRIFVVFGFSIPMLILFSSLHILFYIQYFDNQFLLNLKHNSVAIYIKSCYSETVALNLDYITIVFLVPVIELTLYPLLMKCTRCINFSIRARFLLGIFVTILYELHLLGIELVVMQTSDLHNSTCFYYVNDETVHWYWLIPPKVLYGIALYILLTSSMEFISAQAPYSMRGLLLGIDILLYGLSAQCLHSAIYLSRYPGNIIHSQMEQTVNYGCMAAYCFLPQQYYAQDSLLKSGTLLGEEMKICPMSKNL